MELPQIRPGKVEAEHLHARLVAFFPSAAQGNLVVQLLPQMGVPSDGLAVSPPEWVEGGQGLVLAIACPDPSLLPEIEALCRSQGAAIHRQKV
jgi:hypothetical protein